jgi:hypothetical protein
MSFLILRKLLQLFPTTICFRKTFPSFNWSEILLFTLIQHYLRYIKWNSFTKRAFHFLFPDLWLKWYRSIAKLPFYLLSCLAHLSRKMMLLLYTFFQLYLFFSLDVPSDGNNAFQLLSELKWWYKWGFRRSAFFLPLVFPKDLARRSLITAAT